jgi:hypothetical protein
LLCGNNRLPGRAIQFAPALFGDHENHRQSSISVFAPLQG